MTEFLRVTSRCYKLKSLSVSLSLIVLPQVLSACSQESNSVKSFDYNQTVSRVLSQTERNIQKCTEDLSSELTSCVKSQAQILASANHRPFNYGEARKVMFFKIDVEVGSQGSERVRSVYNPNQFFELPSDGRVPKDTTGVNTEHTWPQSQLKKQPRSMDGVSDIHHLFPCDVKTNGIRSNYPFAELPAPGDKWSEENNSFEPPDSQKGKTARAMFYISTRYDLQIDSQQEKVLRNWNNAFPVTEAEKTRMEKISQYQGNVNPYVLHPEWVNQISDF